MLGQAVGEASRPELKVMDKSDLAGLISAARERAGRSSVLADRLESLVCGLTGEDSVQPDGPPVLTPRGLSDLSDSLDRTAASQDRMMGLIDRLNALVAIGG